MPQVNLFHYDHSDIICDRNVLETTQITYDRRMNAENVVNSHNGILHDMKNEEILSFAGKWMELEIILSEVTQSQMEIQGIYSLISGY